MASKQRSVEEIIGKLREGDYIQYLTNWLSPAIIEVH